MEEKVLNSQLGSILAINVEKLVLRMTECKNDLIERISIIIQTIDKGNFWTWAHFEKCGNVARQSTRC